MNEFEADDENSSFDNEENIFHLMDRILCQSHDKLHKCKKTSNNFHKISKVDQNLMNNCLPISLSKFGNQSNNLKSLDRWKKAFTKVKRMKDPWKNFDIIDIPLERVERYIFDSYTNSWKKPVECYVKMESTVFNRGSMRECFRLKKMSSLFKDDDWCRSGNYIAKRYIDPVDDLLYYDDVKLQMDAKLWGQEYSKQRGIIKKVDICQMSVIKFVDRPQQELYHLEHFIEGDYIKYNSNSGFVDDNSRNTPQAFSHFTFERSGHKLIVVDIQGVGDLYTDPQIHTYTKIDYGNGNLGPRGMALFFYSHICNSICNDLGLEKFDLSPSEIRRNKEIMKINNLGTIAMDNCTKVKSIFEENDNSVIDEALINCLNNENLTDEESTVENINTICYSVDDGDDEDSAIDKIDRLCSYPKDQFKNEEKCEQYFKKKSFVLHRSSCAAHYINIEGQANSGQTILGEIHHEFARLHSCQKLIHDNDCNNVDWEAFMFHEEISAQLGYLEAISNLGRFYFGFDPISLFEKYPYKPSENDRQKGLDYLKKSADFGDRRNMILLGDYYKKDSDPIDWNEAYKWYERAVMSFNDCDLSGGFDSVYDIPVFKIEAQMAEMKYVGGNSLQRDLETAYNLYSKAANNSTIAGNGRFAEKLFNLAEEVYLKLTFND